MNCSIWDFLQLVCFLGVFLCGMKLTSDILQEMSGGNMLISMASNRMKGIITCFLITAIIQGSTAIIVMAVSFVMENHAINVTESIKGISSN